MNKNLLHAKLFKGFMLAFIVSISLLSLQVIGQSSGAPGNLSQCVNIEEIEERVACYDALAGREAPIIGGSSAPVIEESSSLIVVEPSVPAVRQSSAPIVETATAPVIQDSSPPMVTNFEDQFGLKAPVNEEEKAKNELFASIAKVKETLPRKKLITLGNGQVWKQNIAKKFRLREGDEIRIYPTGWGNDYRLKVIDQVGYIQVTRLR